MQVEHIPEWQLSPQEDAHIAALLATAFGPHNGYGGRSFFGARHHLRLVARDHGEIIGHAALTMREISMGAALVPVLGVAEVATHPDHRGQSIASAIINDVITIGRQGLAEFVVLFGVRPIYAGLGFQTKSNDLREVVLNRTRLVKVKQGRSFALMVLATGETVWDDTAVIDLAGAVF